MTIEVYTFEYPNESELQRRQSAADPTVWTTQDVKVAREYAEKHNLTMIANIYELVDSEVVYEPEVEEEGCRHE